MMVMPGCWLHTMSFGLLLFTVIVGAQTQAYPPLNGTGNNKKNPQWGAAGTPYIRQQVPQDALGATGDAMAGANRPSARNISLALTNSPYFKASSQYNSSYLLSALGQLVSNDVTRINAEGATSNGGPAPIPIPTGDPAFSRFQNEQVNLQESRRLLNFTRSAYIRVNTSGPRQVVNHATSFLDASCLYGENETILDIIRVGTSGLLLDDGQQLLPFNRDRATGKARLQMKDLAQRLPQTELRMSGHPNINQNPLPLTMTTLLLREHNRRARQFADAHPAWTDEQIFQEARKWVIGHFQRIALNDYLTGLGIPIPSYKGYNSSVNPSIDTFFSTVSYRYGHATATDIILRLTSDWTEHPKGNLVLMQTYYNPNVVLEAGLEPLIRGFIALPQGAVEARWASSIAGNLMGQSTVNGTDLVAINIQRGRDHGIPDYNTCRRLMGLPPAKSFSDITPDAELAETLEQLYGSVNNVDAYVGGLAEPHYQQAHVGELFFRSIQDQFLRLRDGDFWYYENTANGLFNSSGVDEIRTTSLRDLIVRNTNITSQELPQDILLSTGTAAGVCSNANSGGSNNSNADQLLVPNLLQGEGQLLITRGSEDGWVKVKVTAAGQGWLGFGVAQKGTETPMIGADMVVGRMANGAPQVSRYYAVDHIPPIEASQASTDERIRSARFEQSNGVVTLEFERPLDAPSNAASDNTLAIPLDGPVTFIMARGPGNGFSSLADYHGRSNREIINVPQQLFSAGASSLASTVGAVPATTVAVRNRKAHGVLMTINFMLVMPLGALAARQLRCHWLKNPVIRGALFYVHIATQVTGVIITTVGFIIATRLFGVKYDVVAWGHGRIGVAILTLIYSQLLMGLVRPAASAPTMRRHMWDVGHTLLGRTGMMLGVLNAILGIFIFTTAYGGDLTTWGGLCAASLAFITIIQYMLDRQEKFAVLKRDRELLQAGISPMPEGKDVHEEADADAPPPGVWGKARKLTASNLKRHQDESASVPAPPADAADIEHEQHLGFDPAGLGHPEDSLGALGSGDFASRGFGVPPDDAYAIDHDDVFRQRRHQQQHMWPPPPPSPRLQQQQQQQHDLDENGPVDMQGAQYAQQPPHQYGRHHT